MSPVTDRPHSEVWRSRAGTSSALAGLARRVLGEKADHVTWLIRDGSLGFVATADRARLHIEAADVVTAAYGLHRYLIEVAGRRVCWDTPLPIGVKTMPDGAVAGRLPSDVAYYLNFCTFGYTAAAWDWDRWQREIDWMAFHGITMPLAAVGHEAVLAEVYRAAGLSDDAIIDFLGGPAYLPWQFMGCIDHWGARLDRRWLEDRLELGRRIVAREIEFGMTPVLPGFVGHVPGQLAGKGTTTREWWGFTTHLLDPLDERFGEFTSATVRAQVELLGTAHLYAADPFIEMTPPDDDPAFVAHVAGSLVDGLRGGDPEAVWVLQAWTFDYLDWWTDDRVANFLDSIPGDAMLVLDLWGEHSAQWRRFGGFRGKPWIWCALHDFGGRNDAFGATRHSLAELHAASNAAEPPVGVGLSMEATEQNHLVYELMLDQPSESELEAWVADFAAHRSGTNDPRARQAWGRLLASVYATEAARHEPTERPSAISLRPSAATLDLTGVEQFVADRAKYPLGVLRAACRDLRELIDADPGRGDGVVGHDLATSLATLAGRVADVLLLRLVRSWHAPGRPIEAPAAALLSLLDELDAMLAHRPELCLRTWEEAHARLGHTGAQAAMLRRDARTLISVWNHAEAAPLTDYAARLWSGLVAGLYKERWRVWISELAAAGTERPTDDVFGQRISEVTVHFIEHGWPTSTSRDTLITAVDRVLAACDDALDPSSPRNDTDP